MVNTCATCRHWEAPQRTGWKKDHGDCAKLAYEFDEYDYVAHIEVSEQGYGVRTLPDFGCTLWQARDGVLGNMMTDGRSSWPKESK